MSGDRLYYTDSYTHSFDATIIEQVTAGGRPAVVLNHTYCYPTSGGQPHDTGALGGQRLLDVFVREQDGAIVHVLDGMPADRFVSAEIDFSRRFDYMQQHTGQHILSRAFVDLCDANTVGFHLSNDSVTIDLDAATVTGTQLEAVEQLSNEIVWQNRPVHATILPRDEAVALPLRKVPDVNGPTLRIVEIDGFDWNACGGTHVAHTGEVGQIKIIKLEKQRGAVRVEFRCGERALDDYRRKNAILNRLSAELTCGINDIEPGLHKLRRELKAARKLAKTQRNALLGMEADQLAAGAVAVGAVRVVRRIFPNRDIGELRQLANVTSRQHAAVALFAALTDRGAHFIFAGDASGLPLNALLRQALDAAGGGNGGGSATFAQGNAPHATPQSAETALNAVQRALEAQPSA